MINHYLDMYTEMSWIRKVEERIAFEYKNEEIRCPVHLSVGQEAVPVGISKCLSKKDHVVSAHRSHAHYLAKGGDLKKMMSELFGKANGCARGKGGSMHLIDPNVNFTAAVPIVGSSISIGTGVGFGLKRRTENAKVVVYFGDGASEEGIFFESLDFSILMELPILYVCENNFYSVYTPLHLRQAKKRNLQKICDGLGIKCFSGNGNDVEEVYKLAKKAVSFIDTTGKPALMIFNTYRWLEHCGPNWDDHLGYRKKGELKYWIDQCPIEKIKQKLLDKNLDSTIFQKINSLQDNKINSAILFARKSKFPKPIELSKHVYAK